jgi:vacuolar protein sorting-associated protein 53
MRLWSQLVDNLQKIKSKSETTENIVREICADIQNLDYAKRNLTSTITAIRRLNMLETAVEQLNIMSTERAYREAANLLEAVSQLAKNFESYRRVEKICELLATVRALRSNLQAQVFEEFKMHIGAEMSDEAAAMLADAAQVVTALGPPLVAKLLQWFCDRELADYEATFDPARTLATLDGVERRYAWLRKWLRAYAGSHARALPPAWGACEALCAEFCRRTSAHLAVLLQRAAKETLDVRLLMHVMQKTLEQEQDLVRRFPPPPPPDAPDPAAGSPKPPPSPAAAAAAAAASPAAAAAAAGRDFTRAISRVFRPYMPLYLKLERAHLSDLVRKLLAEETWGPKAGVGGSGGGGGGGGGGAAAGGTPRAGADAGDEEAEMLESSVELFLYIKRALAQCCAVDTGRPPLSPLPPVPNIPWDSCRGPALPPQRIPVRPPPAERPGGPGPAVRRRGALPRAC